MPYHHPTPTALPPLNLPALIAPRIEMCADGVVRIYDPLRRKLVALTPEEWVRQHFTAWMTSAGMGYPAPLMANEVAITLNDTQRRCDTVLYRRRGLTPLMIVEYKAPQVAVTQRVFDQITRYNMALQVPYLAVSNGLTHYCCHIDYATRKATFLRPFPPYSALTD